MIGCRRHRFIPVRSRQPGLTGHQLFRSSHRRPIALIRRFWLNDLPIALLRTVAPPSRYTPSNKFALFLGRKWRGELEGDLLGGRPTFTGCNRKGTRLCQNLRNLQNPFVRLWKSVSQITIGFRSWAIVAEAYIGAGPRVMQVSQDLAVDRTEFLK